MKKVIRIIASFLVVALSSGLLCIKKYPVLKKERKFKFNLFGVGVLFLFITSISCDGFSGMDGMVKDSQTGEALEGVKVEMTSYYKTINTVTNASGEFYTSHSYSCGIKKCIDTFTIKLEKEGYETLEFKESYYPNTDNVEIIDGKNIIKLKKLETE